MPKIKWTILARNDLDSIHAYRSRTSQKSATRLVTSLIDAVIKLKDMPFLGRKVPEFDNDELREIIYSDFRIIYLVSENDIYIIGVLHSSREITNIILNRL